MATQFGSEWGSLSPVLIAEFFPVEQTTPGDPTTYAQVEGSPSVLAPITDANIDFTANWNSPMENMTPPAGLGTFSALLQSGSVAQLLNSLAKVADTQTGSTTAGNFIRGLATSADGLTGASSNTRMNSIQVYNGSPPVKITLQAHFRAWKDPMAEVEVPIQQLVEWQAPKYLAMNRVEAVAGNGASFRAIYASQGPQLIGMAYAGRRFVPFVIENLSYNLTSPRDSVGDAVHTAVHMTIASLTSLDVGDIRMMSSRS